MKMFSLLFFTGLFFCMGSQAQSIKYTYDDSGNRTSRKVILMSSKLKSASANNGKSEVIAAELPKFEDILAEMKITIYPNPTKGMLQVDITGGKISKDARIYLYNVSGTMVRQLTAVTATNHVDMSAQPAGAYIMRIVLDKDNVSEWKIIKE